MYLIDSHCHLNLLKKKNNYKSIHRILENAYFAYVRLILTVAVSIQDYKESVKNFKKYQNILYSCGIHPLYQEIYDIKNMNLLEKIIIKNDHIIAIGETGLDFYHTQKNKKKQINFFEYHLQLSKKYNKPVIIHTRSADDDTINILSKKEFQSCNGIIHSFTSNLNTAKKFLNLGFYISFSGIITFKNVLYIDEIIKYVPLDRLLIETDSPYLSPEPKRGKYNQPSYLLHIIKYIAKKRNISIYDLSKQIKKNFYLLFDL